MRMVHRLAAVAAAVAVTGSPATAAHAQASEDLRPALLTPADLPGGFVPVAAATNTDGAVTLGGNFPGCPSLAPVTGDGTTAAAVTYSKGAVGPYLTHALVHFPAGGAAPAMDRLAAAGTTCKSFSQDLAGITVRFTLTPAQLPATLGERAVGVRMTGDTDFGIAVTADIVAIRRGEYVLWLNDMAVGTTGAGMVGTLAKTAADRCAQRAKGC
ncbi:hypothetical protein AB0H83_24240 [Dactylosporangium sp. NPDC050688]|uniref:hypothetical protein n=1 Tax=Dactylosporangium sp. NPDC050688 TaxID=3157217 RepID=UPI0033CBB9B8